MRNPDRLKFSNTFKEGAFNREAHASISEEPDACISGRIYGGYLMR